MLRFRSLASAALLVSLAACNDSTCPPGNLKCPCGPSNVCFQPLGNDHGAVCDAKNTCQECTLGDPGCPPKEQRCYSPCTADVTLADGGTSVCSTEGLLEGCLAGRACVHGSCVAAGASPPGCGTQTDCPDFQTCVGGGCYSNCQVDANCPSGQGCDRHVCRPRCGTSDTGCQASESCVTTDAVRGFCRPVAPPSGPSVTKVSGSFSLDKHAVPFSNVAISASFTLKNDSPTAQEFIVRKKVHTTYADGNATTEKSQPLTWLTMSRDGDKPAQVQQLTIELDGNGATATINLGSAANPDYTRWDGELEIANLALGTQRVELSYISQPDGQWNGKMEYFTNFPDTGLDAWVQNRSDATALQNVGNAFIQRWAAFRAGLMSVDELKAMTQATVQESWRWPSLLTYCPDTNTACYLFDNPQGYAVYSSSLTQYPIPTGVSELPITINLTADPNASTGLVGKIVSGDSLHEPGDPLVSLTFGTKPDSCPVKPNGVMCDVTGFSAQVLVGGRYITDAHDTGCAAAPKDAAGNQSFTLTRTPWLVPGFQHDTDVDQSTGLRYRYECRDDLIPGGEVSKATNNAAAAGNPIPDGRTRARRLELVDGVLINSEDLVILFKEHFDSFLDGTDSSGFSAYGFMTLKRQPSQLDASSYLPGTIADTRTPPNTVLGVSCSADVLQTATGSSTMPTGAALDALAQTLVTGISLAGGPPTPIAPGDPIKVHYYCEDTGLFDGKDDGTATAAKVACPAGSRVEYFTLGSATVTGLSQAQIAALPCQAAYHADAHGAVLTKGTCQATLNDWRNNALYALTEDPVWVCADSSQAYCSQNRLDLRDGKSFFAAVTQAVYLPLRTEVANAFRYKTRFVNRQGNAVGFAPEICIPDSDQVPYCYDPAAIEAVQARVDCALSIYTEHFAELSTASQVALRGYLTTDFSFEQELDPTQPLPIIHEGFEWMSSELLIMMGDDAYTRAFTSRFDLAGQSVVSFDGPSFEPNGISLSGGAGYEMYNLYQSVQYYEQALNRFYAMSPLLWRSISSLGANNGFVSKDTVATYFAHLIRASSQKSRALSEIARRYQGFHRADLARGVVQRAYTAAYLEAIVLSRIVLELGNVLKPEDRPQLVGEVESAALVYRSAFLQMRETYQALTDEPTVFGFAPDYIPFPALDPTDVDAFQKTLGSAQSLLAVAATKEDIAINSNRDYDTDAAAFQSELVSVRNNYEDQLAQICGTFTGNDGQVYPAVPKYAYLNDKAKLLGNPCGLAGNGQIFQAMGDVDQALNDFEAVRTKQDNLVQAVEIEQARVETQCELIAGTAEYQYEVDEKVSTLNELIDVDEGAIKIAEHEVEKVATHANLAKCLAIVGTAGGTDCPQAAAGIAALETTETLATITNVIAEAGIALAKHDISDLNRDTAKWLTERQCDYATADSNAKVATMVLGFKELEIDAYSAELDIKQKLATVDGLRNEAKRLIAEQAQAEQLSINVEAARNDPDVRIYKNDAILTADATFQAAVAEAYKATKVFEYYTSQSYAHEGDLFLVRLASRGDISLEAYLFGLQQAYGTFRETYGNPDQRVVVLSLRDDVIHVPRFDNKGTALGDAARLQLFRAALTDPRQLDQNGYLVFPLSTAGAGVSPLTRDHKILSIEAEVTGSDVGDSIGRVYLREKGTGVVESLGGDKNYYAFPQRTAVLNPFFNGAKVFDESVYKSDHLRDRPLKNTHWELVLNQKDEPANQDINLNGLTDVRLYITYTDFTGQ